MLPVCCCGCLSDVTDDNSRDIFKDVVPLHSQKNFENVCLAEKVEKCLKLSRGIELITGLKIDKTSEHSARLCEACCKNLISYLDFRTCLLSSLDARNAFSVLCQKSGLASPEAVGSECPERHKIEATRVGCANKEDNDMVENDHPRKWKNQDFTSPQEDSTSLNFNPNFVPHEEDDSYDFITDAKLQHDRTNNNLNESDSSNDVLGIFVQDAIVPKVQENDIESEIDVCSGEDDEVLELDSRSGQDNTVEIGSSSESESDSDIEVCTYEPTGKRIKSYNALSSSLLY